MVVVSETSMAEQGVSFDDWLQKTGATRIASTNAMLKINGGVQSWQLVQFSPMSRASRQSGAPWPFYFGSV